MLLLAVCDHPSIALKAFVETSDFFLLRLNFLIALHQFLPHFDNFIAGNSDFFLHIRDKEVLIELVDV